MLRNVLLMYGLFHGVVARSNSNEAICSKDLSVNYFQEPHCENKYQSICSFGDFFGNKITVMDENAKKHIELIYEARNIAAKEAQIVGNHIFSKLIAERHGVFKEMSDVVFQSWLKYFNLLIDLAVKTKGHNAGRGACGEATKASIANSLFKQLEENTRETVQLISLKGTPIFNFKDSTHVFAIYNSQVLSSRVLKDNHELENIMNEIERDNQRHPAVTCDSWAEYYGTPTRWLDHIKQGKDHVYGKVTWKEMTVTDYSIPSMRQPGMNPKQRRFLIELMRDQILRPAVRNSEHHIKFKK